MAGFKSFVGGEIVIRIADRSQTQGNRRMVDEAAKMGADAVVNLRFTTSSIMSGASETLTYGTAVKLKLEK